MLCVDIVYNVISVNNVLLCYVLIFFTMSFLLTVTMSFQCVVMLCVDILYNVISVNNVLLCYVLIFFTMSFLLTMCCYVMC